MLFTGLFTLLQASSLADDVVAAIDDAGCTKLAALYDDGMRALASNEERASFCASIVRAKGKLLRALPDDVPPVVDGWHRYELVAERGRWRMKLAQADGRVSGLWIGDPAVATVRRPLRWPLRLPAPQATLVFWGGASERDNRHVPAHRQRRALDLVAVDEHGRTHNGDGRANTDHFIWARQWSPRATAPSSSRSTACPTTFQAR